MTKRFKPFQGKKHFIKFIYTKRVLWMLLSILPCSILKEHIYLWHGWPQQGKNPKNGSSYLHAAFTAVTPQPDYMSFEYFSICSPVQMV